MKKERAKTGFETETLPGLKLGGSVLVMMRKNFRYGKIIGVKRSGFMVEVDGWTQPFLFSVFTGHSFKRNAWLV
jgi:hypothetical protein